VKISGSDWRAGFTDEDAVDDETPTAGPANDFIIVDDNAPAAQAGSSNDGDTDDASTSICTLNT
jgi:hypothetical protein